MQRKANLGMNAVLSLSLALGRLIAAREGVELPDVLREMESTIDRDDLYGIKAASAGTRGGPRALVRLMNDTVEGRAPRPSSRADARLSTSKPGSTAVTITRY